MTGRVSPARIDLLRILISHEPAILPKISFKDGSGRKTAKKMQIRDDGSVIFYCGRGPLCVQRFLNDYELVSIVDVALRIADAVTGSNGTRNEVAFDGMTKAILDEAIKKKDYDCVIDILFDSIRNGSNGELCSKYITNKDLKQFAKDKNITGMKTSFQMHGNIGIRDGNGRVLRLSIPIDFDEIKLYLLNWVKKFNLKSHSTELGTIK